VTQGTLRIGAANVLPTTGTLSTSITGVFDLNGFAQTVGTLTSNNANTPGATSGFIINSATNTVSLTVGNGSSANMVYNGQLQDNVALVKKGTGVLTLTNANTYIGGTTVNAGVLDVSNTLAGGSATGIAPVTIAGFNEMRGSLFAGRVATAGDLTLHYDRSVLRAGDDCPAEPPPAGGCTGCGAGVCRATQACVSGACAMCRSDADCCAPFVCETRTGQCLPLPP
jgi:autotransporter-associated beta strand protein